MLISKNRPATDLVAFCKNRRVARRAALYYGITSRRVTVPEGLSHLLVPEVRAEEDLFLATIYTQFSDSPMWEGSFQLPITNTILTAGYGDARSYNEGPIEI